MLLTKEDLTQKIYKNFTTKEVALVNPNIYSNPEYIDYYENYHAGKYQDCYEFLVNNRELLKIKHTPRGHKTAYKKLLKSLK
jgi:hypothetical protein